jgi:fucose permease
VGFFGTTGFTSSMISFSLLTLISNFFTSFWPHIHAAGGQAGSKLANLVCSIKVRRN